MLRKIGLGFLTFIGVLCVIFGIMTLQGSNGGEAFLYFVIGIPCVIPLTIVLVARGGDKMDTGFGMAERLLIYNKTLLCNNCKRGETRRRKILWVM